MFDRLSRFLGIQSSDARREEEHTRSTSDGRYTFGVTPFESGGHSRIYKALDTQRHQTVALKILKGADDPESYERLKQEARVTARISHPNIVKFIDRTTFKGIPSLVLEFIDKSEHTIMRDRLNKMKLSISESTAILLQIASAVDALEQAGIHHRDLSPENIFIPSTDVPWDGRIETYPPRGAILIDLGIAENYAVRGQYQYASPESWAFAFERHTIYSEVFSIGTILYEMLTGIALFKDPTFRDNFDPKILYTNKPLLKALDAAKLDTDAVIATLVKALQPKASERYSSAMEFAQAFRNAVSPRRN